MSSFETLIKGSLAAAIAFVSTDATSSSSPFSVADSICYSKFETLKRQPIPSAGSLVGLSPDRRHVVFLTRRGDPNANETIQRMYVAQSGMMRAGGSRAKPTGPTLLIERRSRGSSSGILDVRWIDDRHVGFLGSDSTGVIQAFSVDIDSLSFSQLTWSQTDVASFATRGGVTLAWVHRAAPPPPLFFPVDQSTVFDLYERHSEDMPLELVNCSTPHRPCTTMHTDPGYLSPLGQQVWISPTGKLAITFTPATNAPAYWQDYRIPFYDRMAFTPERRRSNPLSSDLYGRERLQIVNLGSGIARPLLDAPSGALSLNDTPPEVFWSEDEKSVIVTNTYLPLKIDDPIERAQRAKSPATAEVNVASGKALPVFFEPTFEINARGVIKLEPLTSVRQSAWEHLEISKTDSAGHTLERAFVKVGGKWTPAPTRRKNRRRIDLHVEQGPNLPPRLVSGFGSKARVVFDPNPDVEPNRFGHAELFEWIDENRNRWRGGLTYPPNFRPGKRYPLIVQTHGYSSNKFQLNGPDDGMTAMSAQAFAAAGFLVLQAQDNGGLWTGDASEGPTLAAGLRAGILALIDKGLADPPRVGAIGFSRTTLHVLYLLTRYPGLVRSAVLADGVLPGYYLGTLNALRGIRFEQAYAPLNGGLVDYTYPGSWMNRNELYNLARSSTAVRIESHRQWQPMMEAYVVLKSTGRPTEFIHFPDGSHDLSQPRQQLESQSGALDWMRFWLNFDIEKVSTERLVRWKQLPGIPEPGPRKESMAHPLLPLTQGCCR